MENYYLVHHGVKGMKWGVRKDRVNSPKKIAKLAATRDRLARSAKRDAEENFEAAKNVRTIYRNNFLDKDDVETTAKAFTRAGKKYIETHDRLMSMPLDTISKRQLKATYRRGVREAEKLNFGMDAFDLRDRTSEYPA